MSSAAAIRRSMRPGSALRAGAKHVTILYRRSQLEMPAREEEVQRALEEGIQLKFLCQPIEFLGKAARLSAIRCVHTELTAPDYPLGRNNIQLVPGTEEVLAGQLAILALGYKWIVPFQSLGRLTDVF